MADARTRTGHPSPAPRHPWANATLLAAASSALADPGSPPTVDTTTGDRDGWASISAGGTHSCGVTTDGDAYCWGQDDFGQLGNGPDTTGDQVSPSPVATPAGVTWATIAAGGHHSCGVSTAGNGYCWGWDNVGQLGNGPGTTGNQPTPVPVTTPTGVTWTSIAPGATHTCGVTTTGDAYCWGIDLYGQLGNGPGSTGNQPSPVPVATPAGVSWASVAPGADHTCGVTTGGDAYCWGRDRFGQLGNGPGTTDDQPSPVPVATPTGVTWTSLAPGGDFVCGLTTTGDAYCWGVFGSGQLGNGTADTGNQPSPVPVTTPPGVTWASLTAGRDHTCGVTTDGAGYCWGTDGLGQLGTGSGSSNQYRPSPVNAPAEVAWASITGATFHSCGVTTDREGFCWGHDAFGQLGNGGDLTGNRRSPSPVFRAAQSIDLDPLGDVTVGADPVTVVARASSGLAVTLSADGPCSISDTTVVIGGVGACTVTATQAGNAVFLPAEAQASFTIAPAAATVTIGDLEPVYDGTPKAATVVTDPAGLDVAVTYDGSTEPPVDAGSYEVSVTITDPDFVADPEPTVATLTIARADQTITFEPLDPVVFGDDPVSLAATATSGLPVAFAVSGPCTLTQDQVTSDGAGTCTVTAAQAGDDNRNPATDVEQTFDIDTAPTATVVAGPDGPTDVGTPATFTATVTANPSTGTPTGTVTFATDDPDLDLGATVDVGTDGAATWTTTDLPAGDTTVTATYTGATDHAPSSADVTHTVTTAELTLTGLPATVTVGDSVTVTATGLDAGEPVEWVLRSEPVIVAATTTDTLGTTTTTFTVPDLPAGPHTLTATGTTSGLTTTATTTITEPVPPAADPQTPTDPGTAPAPAGTGAGRGQATWPLPRTGTDPALPIAIALGLLTIGAALHTSERNRRDLAPPSRPEQ